MHIILHQPEIPANTGNIGRTCVATGTSLHLIEPLGFRLNEKEIKRAGMDYWQHLDVTRYMNFQEFREMHPGAKIWMATTKSTPDLHRCKIRTGRLYHVRQGERRNPGRDPGRA